MYGQTYRVESSTQFKKKLFHEHNIM